MTDFKSRYTDAARAVFFRAGIVLARRGFTADTMTILGLVLQVAAVPLIVTGYFIWALVVSLAASLCDALDGAVARAGTGPTKAGAFLDSSLDRVSELMVGAALVVYFVREDQGWGPIVAMLVFMGAAQMVSYTRARAESLGVDCRVGFMSRPERLVGLGIGFVLSWWQVGGQSALVWVIYVLAVATAATVVHRLLHVLRKLHELEEPSAVERHEPETIDDRQAAVVSATDESGGCPEGTSADLGAVLGDDLGDDLWRDLPRRDRPY